jgi:DNA mismatch endonuclease (patch repair protein)
MRAIRRRDTGPERRVRSMLHAAGLRFRVDYPIRIPGHRPIRPDIVFTRVRLAVFVDGCFWHACPEHGQRPEIKNSDYWAPKLERTIERDKLHTQLLETAGWCVLRYWEHERLDLVARHIAAVRAVLDSVSVRGPRASFPDP